MIAALLAGAALPRYGRACPEFPHLDPVLQVAGTLSDGYTPFTSRVDCGLEAAVIRDRPAYLAELARQTTPAETTP